MTIPFASAGNRSLLSNSIHAARSTPKSTTRVPLPTTRIAHAMDPAAEEALRNASLRVPGAGPADTAGLS
jgi:hypothetical protein